MDKISKIFYLNLDRREDRKEFFLENCKRINIPDDKIERFQGLDGLTYKLKQEEKNLFKYCDYKNRYFYNKIACNQLGHYNIIKEIKERNYEYAIICQDDTVFRDDFIECLNNIMNNIPDDTEILNIGFHKFACFNKFIAWDFNDKNEYEIFGKEIINDNIQILKDNANPCSLAYIVTQKGAINLIKYFNSYGFKRATDYNFNDYCCKKNIFYGSIPILCTGNPDLGSDIFN